MKNKAINELLNELLKFAQTQYNTDQILGIFSYGKANFGFANTIDDIDFFLIYIPTINDLCGNIIKDKYTYNNKNIPVYDIREIVISLSQNEENPILESIFSSFYILNHKYEKIFLENIYQEQLANITIKDKSLISEEKIKNGVKQIVEFSLINIPKEKDFIDLLTKKEQEAYNIIKEKLNENYGRIKVSKLVEEYSISNPMFSSVLKKIEKNHFGKVINQGTKGTYVELYI